MSNPAVDNIKNPHLRELADQCVHRSRGDFGMVIEGGVDLELFAERIIRKCAELTLDHKNADYYTGWMDYRDEIKRHFGVKP
jgi:hypothetical protein